MSVLRQWFQAATLAFDGATQALLVRNTRLAEPAESRAASGAGTIAAGSAQTYTLDAPNVTLLENYSDSPAVLSVRFNASAPASLTNCDKRLEPGEAFVFPLPVASLSIHADAQAVYNTHFSVKGW